jgi:hypothetical protein
LYRRLGGPQRRDIIITKIANKSFENMAQFKYLGMKVTNQNLIQEEIKSRLNLVNAKQETVRSGQQA